MSNVDMEGTNDPPSDIPSKQDDAGLIEQPATYHVADGGN
jgi:hypothetical protein